MIWIKAKRVIKAGFVNFWRNGWISLATVLVIVITLFTIGSLIFSRAILGSMISQIQDKVDISIYFKTDAEESDILALKDSVSKLPEVKSAEYVSAEQSLENFKERHKDNALIMQSIEELGENPLGAMLNIKTKETSQYDSVAKYLESQSGTAGGSMIDKINYYQNKKVIDRLSKILDSAKTLGTAISVILVIISIIIAFNTIRLAIYISREEIGVMRLVGASDRFVRGPFIVEGVIYGVISSIIAMIIFYPLTLWLGPMTDNFFSGINIFQYYVANFGQIFLILLLLGVSVGAFSSYIAVKRYLKV
ncbi:ABC transporter permease [Patescibacteria group bacterium]|nr:ABC transporter permease [Patescibacteria group bacterium]MBU4353614.1 ABC transporter permease [Patescibacteria group bacterium]MBU4477031.1 ABC transporter permease [Patescibacteria group bacterium]MCG2698814.1 ABC transporter permease [Candidatus Parcubacteria bacterium]